MRGRTKKYYVYKLLGILLATVMLLVSIPMTVISEGLTMDQIGADDNATLVGQTSAFEEDVSLRDEFSKHYTMDSGEIFAVIFPEPVHYEDNGEWKDVDNRLTYNSALGKYVSANPVFTTAFASDASSGELVSISDGEHTVSWGISFGKNVGGELMQVSANASLASVTNGTDTASALSEAKHEMASLQAQNTSNTNATSTETLAEETYKNAVTDLGKASSRVSYANAMDGTVSLRYSVLHGKVEEDVLLRSKSDFASYTLTVNTGGLTVTVESDGSVSFKTIAGDTVFMIDAPWMRDSAYGFSKDIAVTVSQTGNTATVTYTPSAAWLASEDRVYPVLIDPTFTTRDYTSNYLDTHVDSTYSYNCLEYADEQMLMTGVTPVGEFTAFLKILDIPDISTYDYVEISSAQLKLWSPYDVNYPLYLNAITEAWESNGFTATAIPTSTRISNAIAATSNQYTFNLTSFFANEIFDKYKDYNYYWENYHHGFMIESVSTASDTVTTLYSSEASSQRPIMTLTYSYIFDKMFRDMAVYNFKSNLSSKYMTVHNGLNVTGTNVYQYSENETKSQAFKLEYIETGEYYKIRAMCSLDGSDKVIGFDYDSTISDTSGYIPANVSLYSNSTSLNVQWLIEPVGNNNLFKIISKADHNLALTVQGFSNGTSNGTSTGSSGNIKVQEYTGAANQHWVIESGGEQVRHADDISKVSHKKIEVGDSLTYNCGVNTFGGSVAWSSSNTNIATVSNGLITGVGAGVAAIFAEVKDSLGTTLTMFTLNLTVIMPLSGYEKNYSASYWDSMTYFCNCYSYVLNNQTHPDYDCVWSYQQMGEYAGNPFSTCSEPNIYSAVFNDFTAYNAKFNASLVFQRVGRYEVCPAGTYKVALVVSNNQYHWYRQDSDGLWSHKNGSSAATRLDASGNFIYDPQTADRGSYTQFLGYYAVSPWNGSVSNDIESVAYYYDGQFYSRSQLINLFMSIGIIQS